MWAIADQYGIQSNVVAEATALLQGLAKCKAEGYNHVDVEADPLVLIYILQGRIDSLQNLGCNRQKFCCFGGSDMPKLLKGLCRLYKIGLPSVRYKRR